MPEYPTLPVIATESISIVLLARHAEAHFEEVVGQWVSFLNGLDRAFEILVVDDGSSDRTAELAEQLAARNPSIRLLRQSTPQGEGAALRVGIAAAQHPLLVYAPCNRQYQPDDLRRLLAEIDKVHVVSGFRDYLPMPGVLKWLGRVYRGVARWVFAVPLEPSLGWLGWRELFRRCLLRLTFGIRLQDVGSTFRLFRRSIFARIPIQSDGSFAHVEILAKANFLGQVMTETLVRYQPRAAEKDPVPDRTWKEGKRVFSHPDFGPAVLEGQTV